MKEKLFSLTKKNFVFKYYKGQGGGGQKKNKTENCCQITHVESGAQECSEEGRSKEFNKQNAFRKLTESKKFVYWVNLEAARVSGDLDKIEKQVDKEMKRVKIEIKKDGKWTKE